MPQIATDKPELSRKESAMQWARAYLTDHGGEVGAQELTAVAKAHSTDIDALEEHRRDHTRPFRTVVTHWPCKGLSRVVTDTLDAHAPGGVIRRTSWVHSEPTNCNAQVSTTEEKQ